MPHHLTSALTTRAETARAYREAGWWTDATPHGWVADWAARTPDAPAVIGPDGVTTYAGLHESARRFASGLLALGFRRGDVIGLQLPNMPEFHTAFLGMQIMGAVPCMLPMPYRRKELEPLLAHGRATGFVGLSELENYDLGAVTAELRSALPDLRTVIAAGDAPPAGTVAEHDHRVPAHA